jgi:hypothetical protein
VTGDVAQTRVLTARQLAAFAPYDGRDCGGTTIAVQQVLEDRLDDEDPVVAREVPGLLAELYGSEVTGLLRHTASSAKHQEVRQAAEDVLDRLGD